jgi:hypothetical protein
MRRKERSRGHFHWAGNITSSCTQIRLIVALVNIG